MKKIKLLLAAMAAMVGLSVNAQGWTAQAPADGDFYLYNVGTGTFLSCGEDWGTHAVVGNGALNFTLANNGSGAYTLYTTSTFSYGTPNTAQLQSSGYVDQSVTATTWTFNAVDGQVNTYTLLNATGDYLYAPSNGTIKISLNSTPPTDGYGYWKLINKENLFPETASAENPANVTCIIGDANFESSADAMKNFWAMDASNQNLCGGASPNKVAESWTSAFALSQTITVPNGYYRLRAQGFVREYTETGADYPVVYLNEATRPFIKMKTEVAELSKVSSYFKNGDDGEYYWTDWTNTVKVSGKSITVGARGTRTDTWCVFDNFQLQYLGPLDLSEYVSALSTAVSTAEATEGTIPTAAYNAIAAVVTEYNKSYDNEEDYTEAIMAINTAVSTYASSDIVVAYSRYTSIRSAVKAINSGIDVSDADVLANDGTDANLDDAVASVRGALVTYLAGANIADSQIDLTDAMVDNAAPYTNADYWNVSQTPSFDPSHSVGEFWNKSGASINQIVENLPTGYYRLTAIALGRPNHNGTLNANEFSVNLVGHFTQPNGNTTQGGAWFDEGNGVNELLFNLTTSTDVTIGITADNANGDHWTLWRSFNLEYLGTNPVSFYASRHSDTRNAAIATRDDAAYVNVTGLERTSLQEAIDASPTTVAEYEDAIEALNTTSAAFVAAAPSYDKYVAYRAETVSLWGSYFNVSAPTTAAEALVAVQNLNIAQYNKVASDYTFSATGLIGDFGSWTGTATVAGEPAEPNYLSNEHWSGTTHAYYEQASNGWSNAAGWTVQYQKTCTLPAGSYVIKVAARSSQGTTSSITCSATGVSIPLPNEGGTPNRGINTSGVASWSDSDTFANGNITQPGNEPTVGGKGTGWQWRFLPFTLDAQGEVTMTFYAEATSQHQWMSIADGELLSTTKLAQDVAYDEGDDNIITSTIIADVTIDRSIKEGYNTVCLPFTLTANQVTDAFGSGTEVYVFSEDSADPMDATINFWKNDGSISANRPVLVKATADSDSQTFNGVQVVAAAEAKVEGTNFDFVGTYAPMTVAENDYFIGGGKLWKSAGSTSMKAFRAYIHDKSGASSVKLFIDDVETSIDAINGVEAENGIIYNIAGQRLNKVQKGINIVNGKKVLK